MRGIKGGTARVVDNGIYAQGAIAETERRRKVRAEKAAERTEDGWRPGERRSVLRRRADVVTVVE